MSQQAKLAGASLLTLSIIFFFAYISFANYKPKNLVEVKEVKGATTTTDIRLPYPSNHTILGIAENSNTKIHTFMVGAKPREVQEFYKNILLNDGWHVENSGGDDNSQTAEYRNGKMKIKVFSSAQGDNKTIASFEITL